MTMLKINVSNLETWRCQNLWDLISVFLSRLEFSAEKSAAIFSAVAKMDAGLRRHDAFFLNRHV